MRVWCQKCHAVIPPLLVVFLVHTHLVIDEAIGIGCDNDVREPRSWRGSQEDRTAHHHPLSARNVLCILQRFRLGIHSLSFGTKRPSIEEGRTTSHFDTGTSHSNVVLEIRQSSHGTSCGNDYMSQWVVVFVAKCFIFGSSLNPSSKSIVCDSHAHTYFTQTHITSNATTKGRITVRMRFDVPVAANKATIRPYETFIN